MAVAVERQIAAAECEENDAQGPDVDGGFHFLKLPTQHLRSHVAQGSDVNFIHNKVKSHGGYAKVDDFDLLLVLGSEQDVF